MSVLARYKQLEKELEQARLALESLQQDPKVQRMEEAGQMLRELVGEYKLSVQDIVELLSPGYVLVPKDAAVAGMVTKRVRAPRAVKVYTNPHTGETVETRGGNHAVLRQWRDQWGDAVSDWAAIKR